MYKISFVFLFFTGFLFSVQNAQVYCASPWGTVSEYVEESTADNGQKVKNYQYYAIYNLITGKPVKYAITFEEYPEQNSLSDSIWEKYAFDKIQKAFNAWPQDTKHIIEKSGRAEEFKDILSILNNRKINFTRVNKEEADIVFEFVNYKGARFTFNTHDLSEQKHIKVPNPPYFGKEEQKKLDSFLLHEIGHYYGLGDRYQEGINGSSVVNSTTGDTDSDSIMASSLGLKLTCDDAEGIINLIDLTQFYMTGKYFPRAEKGWNGICKNKKHYRQARETEREDFFDGTYIYTYNPDGTVKSKREAVYPGTYYIPFNEPSALKTPFTGTQKVFSEDKNTITVYDYDNLKKGRFNGYSKFANLKIVDFKALYRNQSWNVVLDYPKYESSSARQDKMKISFSDNRCQFYTSKYFYSENITMAIGANDTVDASFEAKDSISKNKYEVYVSGVLGKERFVFKKENKVKEYIFGTGYTIESDEEMDEEMFMHDVIFALHDKFIATQKTCLYFENIKM